MNRIRQSFVKRSLSALLALTMVLGMGIINVFAAEIGVENQNGAVTFAASSNKKCYPIKRTCGRWRLLCMVFVFH